MEKLIENKSREVNSEEVNKKEIFFSVFGMSNEKC